VNERIISTAKKAEFVSDRMLCVLIKYRWYVIICLNVHVRTGDKIDDVKDSLCEELERVFN
jgi:hypothetical protein